MAAALASDLAPAALAPALARFVSEEAGAASFRARLPDDAKARVIKAAVDQLEDGKEWRGKDVLNALTALRILARERVSLDHMQTAEALGVFWSYAAPVPGTDSPAKTREEALRVVINAIHSTPLAQAAFDRAGGPAAVVRRLAEGALEGEEPFLLSRILFLISVTNEVLARKLVVELRADELLPQLALKTLKMQDGASHSLESLAKKWGPPQLQSAAEQLRVLYNLWTYVTHAAVASASHPVPEDGVDMRKVMQDTFARSASLVARLLQKTSKITDALKELQLLALNWFIRAPLPLVSELVAKDGELTVRLLLVLYRQIQGSAPDKMQEEAVPVIMALHNVAQASERSRKELRREILPLKTERRRFPTEMRALRALLVQHVTSPQLALKTAIGEFLLALCRGSANLLIRHIGIGPAAGVLAAHGILGKQPSGQAATNPGNDSDGEPLDAPPETTPTVADMTDEEKELEAEKLLDLFERLDRTGLVKVQAQVRAPVASVAPAAESTPTTPAVKASEPAPANGGKSAAAPEAAQDAANGETPAALESAANGETAAAPGDAHDAGAPAAAEA